MSVAPALSVVIPALDEAPRLPALLEQLRAQRGVTLEIIVADGGSRDGTPELARAAGATLVAAGRGRGRQMNAAAREAHGDWLAFLHADSELRDPELLAGALVALRAAGGTRVAGHFPLRFAGAAPGRAAFYRYLEGKTRLNRPYTVNGDQGLLLRRDWFGQLGGFDDSLPFLEDQRLAARIFSEGRFVVLPGTLWTSARRFEAEGPAQRYALMAIIMGLHAAGLDEFFARAPAAYAAQSAASPLDLRPFRRVVHELLREQGPARAARTLWRAGRFVRENAWQLAYWIDLRRGAAGLPALAAFDRHVARWLRNPAADGLATLLMCLWFFAWLPLAPRQDRGAHRRT